MTPEEKKVLEGFLSKTLKIDTEEFASLYNDAGELVNLTKASELDAARIKKLKDEKDSQYKRGIKEGATKVEGDLKDKYELDSDLTGIELFDFALTKLSEKDGAAGDVTKHPDYIKLKLESDKLLKAKDKEWQNKLDDQGKEFSRKSILSKMQKKALAELDAMKPILPTDPKKAAKWKEKFIEELSKYEYQEQEQDDTFAVLKEGKPIQDSHGYSKTFADHVKETAGEFFEFQVADPRNSTGHKDNGGTGGAAFIAPKNDDEYVKQMREAKTPEERVKIMKSFTKT